MQTHAHTHCLVRKLETVGKRTSGAISGSLVPRGRRTQTHKNAHYMWTNMRTWNPCTLNFSHFDPEDFFSIKFFSRLEFFLFFFNPPTICGNNCNNRIPWSHLRPWVASVQKPNAPTWFVCAEKANKANVLIPFLFLSRAVKAALTFRYHELCWNMFSAATF